MPALGRQSGAAALARPHHVGKNRPSARCGRRHGSNGPNGHHRGVGPSFFRQDAAIDRLHRNASHADDVKRWLHSTHSIFVIASFLPASTIISRRSGADVFPSSMSTAAYACPWPTW